LKNLAKAQWSQINNCNYLGTSQKLGLALLRAQYGITHTHDLQHTRTGRGGSAVSTSLEACPSLCP
jgi:hypothetical protein